MKYYSEKLNKVYNSVEELNEAEKKLMEEKQASENLKQEAKKHIKNIVNEFNALIDISDKIEDKLSEEDALEIVHELISKLLPLWTKI